MRILGDYTTSVEKSLTEIDKNWRKYEGVIIAGSHNPHNTEELIKEIQKARETGTPFLGICHGYQLMAIEYARNVLDIEDATSEEFQQEGTNIVVKRAEGLKVGLCTDTGETYWSNYEVESDIENQIAMEENIFAVPFHPEYNSSVDKPHPLLVNFITYAREH